MPNPSTIAMQDEAQVPTERESGPTPLLARVFPRLARDKFLADIEKLLPEGDYFYLGGPMTGRPQFNFPTFDSAAAYLRDQGYKIASPAEFDHEDVRRRVLESTDGAIVEEEHGLWEDCLARDIAVIVHPRCVGAILLDGWHQSRGATLETFVAAKLGKPLYEYHLDHPDLLTVIDREERLRELDQIRDIQKAIHESGPNGSA